MISYHIHSVNMIATLQVTGYIAHVLVNEAKQTNDKESTGSH